MTEHYIFRQLFTNFVDITDFAPVLGITKIACALVCLRKDGCSSFFYHTDEKSCVPSLTRHFDTARLVPYNGYQYYIVRPECDQDWILFNKQCYYLQTDKYDCDDARTNCLQKGGNLAKPDSDAEDIFIKSLSAEASFWIGGKKEPDGTWRWQDGSHVSVTYWHPDQPDNDGTCIEQWETGWNDGGAFFPLNSLCEK